LRGRDGGSGADDGVGGEAKSEGVARKIDGCDAGDQKINIT
jgi:hypothetical protein